MSEPMHVNNEDTAPGFAHENLEGWIPALATDAEIREALEKAFDYRGDLTLTLKDGQTVEGYLFDRRCEGDQSLRLLRARDAERLRRETQDPLQRDRRRCFHRQGHRRRQKLRSLGQEVQRKESRRRKEHRHRRRPAGISGNSGAPLVRGNEWEWLCGADIPVRASWLISLGERLGMRHLTLGCPTSPSFGVRWDENYACAVTAFFLFTASAVLISTGSTSPIEASHFPPSA